MNEELKIIIRAELEQFKKAMNDAITGIKRVAQTSKQASKEIDGFTADVNQQGKALSELKQKYVDLAAAHGKESKAAKDAAEQIKKLSAEYKTNKMLAADLTNEANKFDVSLGSDNASQSTKETTENMGELQDTLQGIYSLNIWQFVSSSMEGWKQKAKEFSSTAKEEFSLAGIYFKQAWKEFRRDPDTLIDLDAVGESQGEAIKGSLLSIKEGFKSVGSAVSESFKAIAAAVAAAAAVIVAELIIIIGLAKNAFTVAKEIKAMANQASKAGMDTSTYQEWGYVLKQVGIEEDKLSDFTKKLAERQNEVRDGSEEATKAFETLGISAEEAMGSSQEELFRKSVSALQNISNEAERTSASFRLFSDDATDLTNLLYLTNQETNSLIDNYYALGAAPSSNLINQSKTLAASTQNLDYAWQGLRNTLAEWVLPAVIAVIQWITTAIAYVNVFLQGILGVEIIGSGAANSLNAVGAGTNKVASGAKGATAAIKELLRYTMGFDELNVIPKQSKDSGSSGSNNALAGGFSSSAINPQLPVIEVPDMSKFRAFMDEYGKIIQVILTFSLIGIGVLMAIFGFMGGNIAMAVAGIGLAGLGIAIGSAGDVSVWELLAQGIMNILETIGQFFKDVWAGIVAVWEGAGFFFEECWNGISAAFDNTIQWFSDVFSDAWDGVCDAWDAAGYWFENVWDNISYAFESTGEWFGDVFTTAWDNITLAWDGAGDWFGGIWTGIKNAFGSVGSWFKNTFRDAWQGVKDVFSTGGDIFQGIAENVAGVFHDVVNHIIDGINAVVKVPFDGINWALKKLKGIEIAKVKPFDWISLITVPQIPKLARGGITMGDTLAHIGEEGYREAVLPLERNTEWMDTLADRINSRNNTPSRIVLMVDGRELGYASINSINSITRQTGTLQLQLV